MKEEHSNSNWFLKWEDELPTPDELMPLSQTLITPDLAIAFDILIPPNSNTKDSPTPPPLSSLQAPNSAEFDSADLGPASGDEPTRALKRPRLVWTPQLHKRFVDSVAHLGIKNAVPKTIMQLMSVDGLTRENVASHLQKYRLYLKRMQGVSAGGGGGLTSSGDPAMDRLFSSSPVPALFLQQNGANSDSFSRFSALQHHQQFQPPQYRQMGQFGPQLNGHLEHSFLMSQSQPVPRMGALAYNSGPSYVEDVESGTAKNGRRMLSLFPTGDDE